MADKVKESKERCCEACHELVSIDLHHFRLKTCFTTSRQVEVICETREDWWTALIAWLRSLGGSNGICEILFRLLDLINSLIHLVYCNLSSNPDPECSRTFLANLLAWLKDQDVTNTDQLNSGTKVLLVIVAISVHVALSVLALTLHLPFSSNYFSNFVAKVVAMTRRTGSTTKRGPSSSISAKPQVWLPKDLKKAMGQCHGLLIIW